MFYLFLLIISMPKLLAIDSSASITKIALHIKDRTTEYASSAPRQTAQQMLPLIQQALKHYKMQVSDLDAIVVSVGPGSFTGLRIGIGVAQGLSASNSIPLIRVSSLEHLGRSAIRINNREAFLVAIPASKGEVYFGAYEGARSSVGLRGREQVLTINGRGKKRTDLLGTVWCGVGAGWQYRNELENNIGIRLDDCFPGMEAAMLDLCNSGIEKLMSGETYTAEELTPNYVKEKLDYSS